MFDQLCNLSIYITTTGGESPKWGNHQVESTQGVARANYSSDQAQSSLESPVRETK